MASFSRSMFVACLALYLVVIYAAMHLLAATSALNVPALSLSSLAAGQQQQQEQSQ